eukprot:366023-Chlamydomonas_euryale.AAC.5
MAGCLAGLAARHASMTPWAHINAQYATQLLLSYYSRQDDIVVGTPYASRRLGDLHGVVGYFATTLAVRTQLGGGLSFQAVVGRVTAAVLGAIGNSEVPFARVVDALRVERSSAYNPVFQVLFVMPDAQLVADIDAGAADDGSRLNGRVLELNVGSPATFDLVMELRPEGILSGERRAGGGGCKAVFRNVRCGGDQSKGCLVGSHELACSCPACGRLAGVELPSCAGEDRRQCDGVSVVKITVFGTSAGPLKRLVGRPPGWPATLQAASEHVLPPFPTPVSFQIFYVEVFLMLVTCRAGCLDVVDVGHAYPVWRSASMKAAAATQTCEAEDQHRWHCTRDSATESLIQQHFASSY